MALRDIIGLLGTISEIRRYQQAADLAAQHERTSAFGEFTALLPHLRDSGSADELIRSYASTTGIPETALRDVASRYQQPSADLRANIFQRYIEANAGRPEGDRIQRETAYAEGTGANAGAAARSSATMGAFDNMDDAMRRGFTSAVLTGLGVGDAAMQNNLASLPVSELTAFNRIKGGTQTSQPQQDENALRGLMGGEDLNQRDRALRQEGILGLIAANSRSGAGSNQAIEDARNRYNKNLETITTKALTPSGQVSIVSAMREDWDLVHGQGSFERMFPEVVDAVRNRRSISPGLAQKIFFQIMR